MSYITIPIVVLALKDPLRQCLRDKDPYVRKTAAICVAKLYVHDPVFVKREGLLEMLHELLTDPNATVVANAVASLMEISDRGEDYKFTLNLPTASKLVTAMAECSE
jgi:vesicle coat complex subunit